MRHLQATCWNTSIKVNYKECFQFLGDVPPFLLFDECRWRFYPTALNSGINMPWRSRSSGHKYENLSADFEQRRYPLRVCSLLQRVCARRFVSWHMVPQGVVRRVNRVKRLKRLHLLEETSVTGCCTIGCFADTNWISAKLTWVCIQMSCSFLTRGQQIDKFLNERLNKS